MTAAVDAPEPPQPAAAPVPQTLRPLMSAVPQIHTMDNPPNGSKRIGQTDHKTYLPSSKTVSAMTTWLACARVAFLCCMPHDYRWRQCDLDKVERDIEKVYAKRLAMYAAPAETSADLVRIDGEEVKLRAELEIYNEQRDIIKKMLMIQTLMLEA